MASINLSTELLPFVKVFQNELDKEEARRSSALHSLATLYVQNAGCTGNDEWQNLFSNALHHSTSATDNLLELHLIQFKAYLKLLYKMQRIENLLQESCRMSNQYPKEVYPLEWICKIFVEYDTKHGSNSFSIQVSYKLILASKNNCLFLFHFRRTSMSLLISMLIS